MIVLKWIFQILGLFFGTGLLLQIFSLWNRREAVYLFMIWGFALSFTVFVFLTFIIKGF